MPMTPKEMISLLEKNGFIYILKIIMDLIRSTITQKQISLSQCQCTLRN